jgi:uncharacterized protein (UPF0332 family)
MATWQEIGIENYQAGRQLLDAGRYRSSVSRFYYAAFSLLTHELSEAGADFGDDQETPNHKGLPRLIRLHPTLPAKQKADALAIIRRLYSARISADYQRRTTDESITRSIMRDTARLFQHFGVEHD